MNQKRILLTAVSGKDPYSRKDTKSKEYQYGSLLAILRKQKEEGTPMDEIYMYLSFEMAVKEILDQIFSKSIQSIYGEKEIQIHYFPKDILENLREIQKEIEAVLAGKRASQRLAQEDVDKIILPEMQKETNQNREKSDVLLDLFYQIAFQGKTKMGARTDVNEYGSFYAEYNEMLEELKRENNVKDCKIYINISSGTPAMQSDLNLIGITNTELDVEILQADSPRGMSNNNYVREVYATEEELRKVKETEDKTKGERNYKNRVKNRSMKTTKRLILLKNLEGSFEKSDFAGVSYAIEQNRNILTTEMLHYASNLYYRYIGDSEGAQKAYQELKNSGTNQIELYPLTVISDQKFREEFENMVEKFNVMKIKAKRNEFNDWLLISTPIIEKIIGVILEVNGISLDYFSREDDSGNRRVNERIFEQGRLKDNRSLARFVKKNDGKFLAAYGLIEVVEATLIGEEGTEIVKILRRLDTTRPYRIRAAHSADFVLKEVFEKNREQDIEKEFENRLSGLCFAEFKARHSDSQNWMPEAIEKEKRKIFNTTDLKQRNQSQKLPINEEITRVEEVHEDIEKLLEYIYQFKSKEIAKFKDSCNIYQLIEEQIIKLLKEQINEYE